MKALRFIIVTASLLSILACSNPIAPSASKSLATATGSSTQAAYAKLDATDSSAWAAAVSAGDVRQGTVLVKTGPSFSTASLAALEATQTGTIAGLGGTWRHLSVALGTEASTIQALRKTQGVQIAEPEMRLHLPSNETRTRAPGLSSSVVAAASKTKSIISSYDLTTAYDTVFTDPDPYIPSAEYSLSITNAITSYGTYLPGGSGSKSAPVYTAVIDTGLNFPHQDFHDANGNLIVAYAKSAFNRESATSYTYVGDNNQFYPLTSSDLTVNWDDDGHGTHVAGILGAVGNNGVGIAGVMWSGLKLISYKVFTDNESDPYNGSGSDWAIYGALEDVTKWWISNHGTQTTLPVNMSLGGFYASEFEMEMITYALQNHVVVIAAMGNDGRTTAEYPAAYTGVIAVGATDGTDQITPFSTSGSWIAVSAPGLDIISTYNGSSSDYEYDSGTSMATPFVTGLSAYTLAYAPALLPDQLKTVLMDSADSIDGSSASAISTSYGAGRVDVLKTLTFATGSSVPASGSVYSSQPITVTVNVGSGASATPTADIAVYLYDSSGNYIEDGYTGSDGTISFWLLKPGSYTAKANDGSSSGTSGSITIGATTAASGTISLTS